IAWNFLRSVPIKASFKEQLDIFKLKHTWFCTITYVMTFGSFSGLSAAFPMLIKSLYGTFPGAPDPLQYAFLGPLVGSLARLLCGPVADKCGGATLTHITGIVLSISTLAMAFVGLFTPTSLDQFTRFVVFMLILHFFTGIDNAATFRQYPIIFADSPRQSAGVIGWTAAVAAYGPFIFSTLIGSSITNTGSPSPFFYGTVVFFVSA